ncbi:hypothetical protein FLM9_1527 [Candidatus Synechococcus spongiarum]|uniref:Uncharacterized protein n=1 Tax=Candidatus Synechococcus spongiarum TaxID=431041 RepID=A0A161KK15_9SYNE|nr:hypothetical protein FLM9_1527 [Candidatus Synechococcus spongiarum]
MHLHHINGRPSRYGFYHYPSSGSGEATTKSQLRQGLTGARSRVKLGKRRLVLVP